MIIFLFGEDTYRSKEKLRELKEKFLREVDKSGNSIAMLDGENVSIGDINEAIGSSSLLVKRRMVIIENIFSNKKKDILSDLAHCLKNKKDENIIIFWDEFMSKGARLNKSAKELFDYLKTQKFVQEFNLLSNTEVINWSIAESRRRGAKISRSAAQVLTSLLGSNLWQISNEIEKLINYKRAKDNKLIDIKKTQVAIEKEDVEGLVRGNFDESIFTFTDAISAKNKSESVRLLEELLDDGLAETYLLTMVVRQFRILLQIREALDSGFTSRKIINTLKLHPFIVQKGIGQVRNFSSQFLKNILSYLVEVDYKLKTGQGDFKTNLDLLFIKL